MATSEDFTILRIYNKTGDYNNIHVELVAATEISFALNQEGCDYNEVLRDICNVAPHMMALDSDLMEMHDDAGRTQPKGSDVLAVRAFLKKYKDRLPDTLKEIFA